MRSATPPSCTTKQDYTVFCFLDSARSWANVAIFVQTDWRWSSLVVLAWPDNASPPRYAGECHCVSPQLSCLLPEAPCTNAIRTAQSIVADVAALGDGVGDGQAMDLLSENGIGALARCRLHRSEHDLHKVIRDFDLELPIPLYKVPGQDFEALHIRDWISLILRKDLWHTLSGLDKPDPERCRRIWRGFWRKYRQQNGGHPIFEMEAKGLIKLENSAACLFHGDEGRGKKEEAILVMSMFSIMGKGTRASQRCQEERYLSQRLNYGGHTFLSRRMLVGCPQPCEVYLALLEVRQSTWLLKGRQIHEVNGSGWSLLDVLAIGLFNTKQAFSKKTFYSRGQSSLQMGMEMISEVRQRYKEPSGICHLCLADQPGFPYEEMGRVSPNWLRNMNLVSPFASPPELLQVPHNPSRSSEFVCIDAWHSWHLGLGKNFLGSALVLANAHFEGSTIPLRFEAMSEHYLAWCKRRRQQPYLTKIAKETCHWDASRPCGGWNKGSVTTVVCAWLIAVCEEFMESVQRDELMLLAYQAAKHIHSAMEALYREDLWIRDSKAREIGQDGIESLFKYTVLAKKAFDSGKRLFALMPKGHILDHVFLTGLYLPSLTQFHILNPMAHGCQMSEDFSGPELGL